MSWLGALLAGLLAGAMQAAPATATTGMIDLGVGNVSAIGGRGDVVGVDALGMWTVWPARGYRPILLGVPEYDVGGPADINERGDVVVRDYYWHAGRLTELAHPSGFPLVAVAVNDRGVVAGHRYVEDGYGQRAFIWRDGVFADFPGLRGIPHGTTMDINNRGQVLLQVYDGQTGIQYSAVWTNDRVVDIGGLGGTATFARFINDNGVVVGTSRDVNGLLRPFVWRDGVMTALAATSGTVTGLNNRGDVAGMIGSDPILWRGGVPIQLTPGRQGYTSGVNERGDVAGYVNPNTEPWSPFRWRNGSAVFFATPGLRHMIWVAGIDEHGRLAGVAHLDTDENWHAVVWTGVS